MAENPATIPGPEVLMEEESGAPTADLSTAASESEGLDTYGYPRADGAPWSDPADLWVAGADAQSPIPVDSEGDASLTHGKMVLGHGEDGEDEAEDFIQEDESGGDDDVFDQEWALANAGNARRQGSSNRSRPDSAAHGRRNFDVYEPHPCPTMDAFRVPVEGLDPEEATELRITSIWPSFVVAYHRIVSRKYAVGSSRMLLQYLQRGYPEYCVEAISNAVKSVTKMRSGSAAAYGSRRAGTAGSQGAFGMRDSNDSAPMRLVIMGNYCAELLWTAGHHDDAKKILNKMEILTSVYAAEFAHKLVLRVWTLCNMGILHAEKGLPVAGFDFISTALDEAMRHEDLGARLVVSSVRAAFLCRAAHFERACHDVAFARFALDQIDDDSAHGPGPNAASHHMEVCRLFNGAVACMCLPQARVADARRMAEAAWSQVLASGDSSQAAVEADLRKRCLRLRDALAQQEGVRIPGSRHDVFRDYLNAVRAASMTALWSQERLTIKVNKLPPPRVAADAAQLVEGREGAGLQPQSGTAAAPRASSPRLAQAAPRDIFALVCSHSRPSSSMRSRGRARPLLPGPWSTARGGQGQVAQRPRCAASAGGGGGDGDHPRSSECLESDDVWEKLRHAASQVALDPSGGRRNCVDGQEKAGAGEAAGKDEDQPGSAASDAKLSFAEASQKSIEGLHQLRPASRGLGAGAVLVSRSEAEGAQAHLRHVRTRWLLHSPVVACAVSPAVEEFLVAAESLFEADEVAACLAQVERLVQGLASGKVREALGQSLPRHVLTCLCHLCNQLGVRCFLKRRSDDGLVFFGTALVFAARIGLQAGVAVEGCAQLQEQAHEQQVLQCLLKAWTLDQLAFCYSFAGESEAALAALAACCKACDDAVLACQDAPDASQSASRLVVGGGLAAAHELKLVASIHRMQVELVGRRPLESLQGGLELLQHLRGRLVGDAGGACASTAAWSGGGSGREAEAEAEERGEPRDDESLAPSESHLVAFLEAQQRRSKEGAAGRGGSSLPGRRVSARKDEQDAGDAAGSSGVEAGSIKQRVLNVQAAEAAVDRARRPFECIGGGQVSMGPLAAAAATACLRGAAVQSEEMGGGKGLGGDAGSVWMALYLGEVAANAVADGAGQRPQGLEQRLRGHANSKGKGLEAGGLPPAVHSLEYVTAHVSHATAAAAVTLGRVDDALPLLSYAQEVGAKARGPAAVAAPEKEHAVGPRPRRIRARLLSAQFTGICGHASASCPEGRKDYGRPGSGWDLAGGPASLAKLVEEGKAFLEFMMRNPEWSAELSRGHQDAWSGQAGGSGSIGRPSRPPSSASTLRSAATTRPSSALSRPPSAKPSASIKDSMAGHAGRLRVRPWSAAASSADARGLPWVDPAAQPYHDGGLRANHPLSRSKVGRVRPASAIGLSRQGATSGLGRGEAHALGRGAGGRQEEGAVGAVSWKPMCDTLKELEASAHEHELYDSCDSMAGLGGISSHVHHHHPPARARAAYVSVSGPQVVGAQHERNRRPRSALPPHKSTFGCGHSGIDGIHVTRHAMRMETAGVRAPRQRPASALR